MAGAHRAVAGTFGGAPVFVDASGRRRRTLTFVGWLGAAVCAAYVAAFGVTLTTSVGALGEVAGSTLTPTPLPPDDDGADDGPDAATPDTPAAPTVTATPAVAAAPVAARAVRPAAATAPLATAPRTRAGTGLVDLRRREAATAVRRAPVVRRAVPATPARPAAAPARAATATPAAPATTPAAPATGTTTTPRSGTGTTTGTGTGTTTGTGAGTGTGTGSTTGTGTTTTTSPTPTPLMDAATSDVLTTPSAGTA
jgi:hypothetical protein